MDQRQIVDLGALQRNAADHARGLDLDARTGCEHGFTACHRSVNRRRARRRRGGSRGPRCSARGRLRRRLQQLGLALHLALLLHLRHVVEILPGDQDEAGQNDGKDRVAVVGHLLGSRHSIRIGRARVTRPVGTRLVGTDLGRRPVEAAQRRPQVVNHGRKVAGQRVTAAD